MKLVEVLRGRVYKMLDGRSMINGAVRRVDALTYKELRKEIKR